MDYGALAQVIGGLVKMRGFQIFVVLLCIYYGAANVSNWTSDRMEFAKYDYSPFWDNRVLVPVSKIMVNDEVKGWDVTSDIQKMKYFQFPKADDILKEKLFFNNIAVTPMNNSISFSKGNIAYLAANDTLVRTIDDSIIYFSPTFVFKLDENDYNSLKNSDFKIKGWDKNKRAGLEEIEYKSLPENWKDLPLLAVFKNEFSMVDKYNRWLLTVAAKDESFADIKNKMPEYEKQFLNYKNWKKEMDEYAARFNK